MEGYHPFAGVLESQESVGRVDLYAIREGLFPYGDAPSITPPPAAPVIKNLHNWVQRAFRRCFEDGYQNLSKRPTAKQWKKLLVDIEPRLRVCAVNSHHYYFPTCGSCLWCERSGPQARSKLAQKGRSKSSTKQKIEYGIAAVERGEFHQAMQIFTQVIEYGNDPIEGYMCRIKLRLHLKQYNELADDCHAVLKIDPNHAEAHFYRSFGYFYGAGSYVQVQEALTQAIDTGYTFVELAYYNRAVAYRVGGYDYTYDKTRADLEQYSKMVNDPYIARIIDKSGDISLWKTYTLKAPKFFILPSSSTSKPTSQFISTINTPIIVPQQKWIKPSRFEIQEYNSDELLLKYNKHAEVKKNATELFAISSTTGLFAVMGLVSASTLSTGFSVWLLSIVLGTMLILLISCIFFWIAFYHVSIHLVTNKYLRVKHQPIPLNSVLLNVNYIQFFSFNQIQNTPLYYSLTATMKDNQKELIMDRLYREDAKFLVQELNQFLR